MSIVRLIAALAAWLWLTAAAPAPAPAPVVVIGIDGLTFDVLDPLIKQRALPNLGQLVSQGTTAILMSEEPMRSPALWTTIATGQSRAVHQIYDFVTGSPYWPKMLREDTQRLVTSDMRKSPALWEYADAAGDRSLIVGWLNTWPAQHTLGLMIAPYVALGQPEQTTIKGRIYSTAKQQTYPPNAFKRIRPLVYPVEAIPPRLVDKLAHLPTQKSSLYRQIPFLKRYIYAMKWSLASALTNTAILERALSHQNQYQLVMTYFDGADTLAHRFWLFRQPREEIAQRLREQGMDPNLAGELQSRFRHVIEGYYKFMDVQIGRIVRAAGPNATILVVSDHGWGALDSHVAPHPNVPFDGEHRLEGVFIANGPHIARGRTAHTLNLYDIAPTVLHLMKRGIPADMQGSVALDILDDDFATQHPPSVATTIQRQTDHQRKLQNDAYFSNTEIERLRSLGYVQ